MMKPIRLFLLFAFLLPFAAKAQLAVTITADDSTLCLPATACFTSVVTGGTAPYLYHWTFGFPGGTSSLPNPCVTYTGTVGGNITVTLKVTDATNTSVIATLPIITGTPPVVTFTNNGQLPTCAPKTVTFNASGTALNSSGQATYYWDFGDGHADTVNTPTVTYTYMTADTFHPVLTVVNGAGCTSQSNGTQTVIVSPSPVANFFSFDNIACKAPATVHFTDASSNVNSSTQYSWVFGSGPPSSAVSPTHVFPAGIWDVTLTVSGGGCSNTITKTGYVKVGTLQPNFAVTSSATCADELDTFTNTSVTIAPDTIVSQQWFVDGILVGTTSPFYYSFPTAGTHIVKMKTFSNGCVDSLQRNITINPKPVINFTADSTYNCTAPFTVHFTATVLNAGPNATYTWDFGDPTGTLSPPSNSNTATHTYTTIGSKTVTLYVRNNTTGCEDSLTKTAYIVIAPSTGTITAIPDQGCTPMNVALTVTTSAGSGNVGPCTGCGSNWVFGDTFTGNSATGSISHIYTTTGVSTYTTTVTYVTSTGCTGTATKIIKVGEKPTASFTISNLTPCATSEVVNFTSTSQNVFTGTTYTWYPQGNPGPASQTTAPINTYSTTYNAIACYTPVLIVSNNGCKDTATSPSQVCVKGPAANFTFASNNCANRNLVTFTNTSVSPPANGQTFYSWNFGDPASAPNNTSLLQNPTHQFSGYGTYTVVLTATNPITGCTSTKTQTVTTFALAVPTSSFTVTSPVCVGQPTVATYTGIPQSGFNYTFTFGNAPIPNTYTVSGPTTTQSYTFPAPGTNYAVKLKIDIGGCADSSIQTGVVVNGPIITDFTVSDPQACVGQALTFTATESATNSHPIQTRLWSFGTNPPTTASTNPATKTYTLPGTYTVSYTVTDNSPTTPAGGCSVTLTKPAYVNVLVIPTPTGYFNDTVKCPHTPVQFINTTNDSSLSYVWNFNDPTGPNNGTSTDINPVYSFSAGGIHHITLTATNANGCQGVYTLPDSIHILDIQALFTMSDSVAACQPLTVCMTNQSQSATSYNWSFGDGGTASVENPCHTYQQNGTFNVVLIAKNAQGCADTSSTHHVMIAGPLGTLVTSTDNTCAGSPITFTIANTNATSFLFDFRDGVTQTTTNTSITHQYDSCGDYLPVITLSDGTTCHFIIEDLVPIVIDRPNADFSFAADSSCQYAGVQFTDLSTGCKHPVTAWAWDFDDAGATSTLQNPSHAFTNSGIHHVRLIAKTAAGCVDTMIHDVYVRLNPSVTVTATSPGFCAYSKDTLVATSVPANVTYSWSPGGSANDSIIVNPTVNTTYTVIGTDIHGCTDTATKNITVYAVPVVTITGDSMICAGDSTQLFANVSPLTATYDWHLQPFGFRPSDVYNQNPHLGPNVTTPYVVIATTAQGCKDTGYRTVTVTQKPVLTVNVPNAICLGDSEQLIGGGLSPSGQYMWTPPGGVTGPVITVHPTQTTTYTLTGIDGCNALPKTVTVVVNQPPPVNAGPDVTICVGQSTTLVGHGAAPNGYSWLPGDGTLSCTNCDTTIATPTATETYTVIGSDLNGCLASDKVTVNVIQHVQTGIDSTDMHICQGESTTLSAHGGSSYTWTPTEGLDNPNSAVTVAHPDVTTIYTVYVTENSCFTDTFTATVNVTPKPTVDLGPDIHLNSGSFVQLHPTVTNTTTYVWTPEDGLSCTDCLEPIASPLISTTYVLVASNDAGCKDSDNINITVVCDNGLIWFPNTFTPNGDGQNDLFYPRCQGTLLIRAFRVYNRWGEVVFERTNIRVNDLSNAWDGTYKGDPLKPDTFIYTLDAACLSGIPLHLQGDINLVR